MEEIMDNASNQPGKAFVNVNTEYDDAFIWDGERLFYKPIKDNRIYELRVRQTGPAPITGGEIVHFRNSHDIGMRMGDEWLILAMDDQINYMMEEYRYDSDFNFDREIVTRPNFAGV